MLRIMVRAHDYTSLKCAYVTPSVTLPTVFQAMVDTLEKNPGQKYTDNVYSWGIIRVSRYDSSDGVDCAHNLLNRLIAESTPNLTLGDFIENID